MIFSRAFPSWVQRLIGTPNECFAHEYSTVDPVKRRMEMVSVNLTFCSILSMREKMSYFPHPDQPEKTVMRQVRKTYISCFSKCFLKSLLKY